jgi:hypothetical protein
MISSHTGVGLDADVKEVEVSSSAPEFTGSHPRVSEDLEVMMELLLLVPGCHTMGIRINSSVSSTTSSLTHGSNARISLLDFIDWHQRRIPTNQGGNTAEGWDILLVGMVGSTFCSIQDRNRNFVLFRKHGDGRSARWSVIGTGRIGVLETTILLERGRTISTVTQIFTHGLYLRLQHFNPLLQFLLSMIGLINLDPMTIDLLL